MLKRKWTAKDVEYLQVLAQDVISLDTKIISDDGDEESEIGDFVEDKSPTPEEVAIINDTKELVSECIHKFLSPREEMVIRLRYGIDTNIPMTLEEIGEKFGLTRERIRQIEAKAMKKLKARLTQKIVSED